MEAISPVLAPEFAPQEIVYAKDQKEYLPLPVLRSNKGIVMSRWKLTDKERKAIAQGADIWLSIWTFNQPLHPLRIEVAECQRSAVDAAAHLGLLE